ncbi:LamG domain-containing protein [Emticicia sp. CRIBPO]|uniref:LamG domain-containing protein n=1 Tax=Emticicia sp. CRIBPO TaxID=2683258 RepID=UPI00141311EC|nr:LamG domain-containing protein [Emticicia sp. CRIBPO]NBA85503.1 LamG domain-containing protein [Emticicia sp. CRIBPO]
MNRRSFLKTSFLARAAFPVAWPTAIFFKRNRKLIRRIKNTPGFIALWDFKEDAGQDREAIGEGTFPLKEMSGAMKRIDEGPISGYSALFENGAYLSLPHAETGKLNLHGAGQGVTVVAWVKWQGGTGFIGGMWNESASGGKRQYGLFVSLPYYNGDSQVCGHISYSGKPTPPFPYSIDYSASAQVVPKNEWACVAFTYDGQNIRSFFNGVFEERAPELIQHTRGFEGYPDGITQRKNPYAFAEGMGNNGSDFTVGAVLLSRGMGNFFKGQIGGLCVFDRALTEKELGDFV